jgi:uncharacterized membrane protein
MDDQGTTKTRGELGPIGKTFIILCTICGVAYGMIWGSPFGKIPQPVIIAFAIVVVTITLVLKYLQKKRAGEQ